LPHSGQVFFANVVFPPFIGVAFYQPFNGIKLDERIQGKRSLGRGLNNPQHEYTKGLIAAVLTL